MSTINDAQAAIGCQLIEREVCDLQRVHSARFAGPERPLKVGTRPSLVVDPGNRETDVRVVDDEGDTLFSRLLDVFYATAEAARGRPPYWLFEKEDGTHKAPCTVSAAISKFTAAAGARVAPTVLRERRVQGAKRERDLSNEALRDLVDASTTNNARFRYEFLDQLEAAKRFSEGGKPRTGDGGPS